MALSEYVLVNVLYSRPDIGSASLFLNSGMIAYAGQEYFLPVDEDDSDGSGYRSASEYETGAMPVVHIFLKHWLIVTKLTEDSPPLFPDQDDGLPIMPQMRPTDIWIEGFLEDFYGLIMGDRPPAEPPQLGEPLIDYYTEIVTDTTIYFDITTVTDADTYYVAVNGTFIQDSSNQSISLTGLDASTDYAIVIQARKSDITFRNSPLHVEVFTTAGAAP